jgi:inner membrane protein COX18
MTQMSQSAHRGPAVVERNVARAMAKKKREIYARWGCQGWRFFLPVLQLPIWLVMIESIRGMCGTHKGLLGLVTDWSSSSSEGMPAAQVSASSAAVANAEVVPDNLATGGVLEAAAEAGATSLDIANEASAVPIEHSMANEGILWFTDLTAPDPMLVLPFMLSATMFLNIFSKEGSLDVPYLARSKSAQRWTRILGMVALAAGPLTLQVPSGMLVYWVSSALLGYGQFVLLRRFMPLKPPPKPCKPPVRNSSRNDRAIEID